MPAVRKSPLLTAFWKLHRGLYRFSGGRLGSRLEGNQVIELTTIGHKSGKARRVMLYAFMINGHYTVVGSNAGSDSHPGWYLNLESQPRATMSVEGEAIPVSARILSDPERQSAWEQVVLMDDSYAEYPKRTERVIPVVQLEPRSSP